LRRWLRQAFALDAPALVHVPVGAMPSPWNMILLPRIRGFADTWQPALRSGHVRRQSRIVLRS
jgi:hypothetical protein